MVSRSCFGPILVRWLERRAQSSTPKIPSCGPQYTPASHLFRATMKMLFFRLNLQPYHNKKYKHNEGPQNLETATRNSTDLDVFQKEHMNGAAQKVVTQQIER